MISPPIIKFEVLRGFSETDTGKISHDLLPFPQIRLAKYAKNRFAHQFCKVISKKESPAVYLPHGVRSPSAFLTAKHTKHTKIMGTEHSRTFLCLFVSFCCVRDKKRNPAFFC